MDFKVGDRVVATENHDDAKIVGLHGTVRVISGNVGVEFDTRLVTIRGKETGHCLDGSIKHGFGWWVPSRKLKLEEPESWKTEAKAYAEELDRLSELTAQIIQALTPTQPTTFSKPPKLTPTEVSMIAIAKSNYPYAVKDSTGKLWFYKEVPYVPNVFETSKVV